MKEFKKDSELFQPRTKRAEALLEKLKEFNNLVEYLKSEQVEKILTEEFGTTSKERYASFDNEGHVSEYMSPTKSYIRFSPYDDERVGRAFIYKDFSNVTADGKIGKKIAKRASLTPGFKGYEWETHLRQVDDNKKPGKKFEVIDVEKAFQNNPKNENVIIAKKLVDLFFEQDLEIKIKMVHYFNSDKYYIDRKIYMDYLSFQTLRYEASKFFTPSLLSRDERLERIVKERIKKGYLEKTKYVQITNKYNEWMNVRGKKVATLEFGFPCNSYIMFNQITLRLSQKIDLTGISSVNSFEFETYNVPNFEDIKKIEDCISQAVNKRIP